MMAGPRCCWLADIGCQWLQLDHVVAAVGVEAAGLPTLCCTAVWRSPPAGEVSVFWWATLTAVAAVGTVHSLGLASSPAVGSSIVFGQQL
jgi:hypothetical protein